MLEIILSVWRIFNCNTLERSLLFLFLHRLESYLIYKQMVYVYRLYFQLKGGISSYNETSPVSNSTGYPTNKPLLKTY